MRLALGSHDPARCAALWATLRRHGTFVSPTLITRYNETAAGIADLSGDPAARAVTPGLIGLIWREDVAAIEGRDPADEEVYRAFYRAAAARTAEAAAAGVRLLVGTDTGDVFVAPGIGLHREMALWRGAGIPPRAILAAATAAPAAYFGLTGRIGRVAPGEVADLLFLDSDPLADLAALRRPRAVMQAGRLYDRAALDAAVAGAEAAAASWRYPAHFLRDLLRNPLGFAG
jgi:imidazolonepropionase-like amidohydrolase